MDNRVLTYITPIEQKILEGIKFYNNINESAYYKTDSYKTLYNTIKLDLSKDTLNLKVFDEVYSKIFYWEFSKLFYGQYGKPGAGMGASGTSQDDIFKVFWSKADASLKVILQENARTFPKTELSKIKTALPKELSNPDEFVNRLKTRDFSGFSEELKSYLYGININIGSLSQYIKNLYNNVGKNQMVKVKWKDSTGNPVEQTITLDQSIGKKLFNKLKVNNADEIPNKLKTTFQNLSFNKLEELDLSVESLASSIFIDCYFYAIANSIISSKKGVDSENKTASSSSVKSSGATVNKRKSSTTSTNSQVSMTDAERLEILRKRLSLKK